MKNEKHAMKNAKWKTGGVARHLPAFHCMFFVFHSSLLGQSDEVE
jgi:hypothetical protein